MTIMRIERVVYGVTDVSECARFFGDFGLTPVGDSVFATRTGQRVEVRRHDDPALPPAVEDGSTVREIVWGVDTAGALDALAAELSRDREVTTGADGVVRTRDETGYGIGLAVADITDAAPAAGADNVHGDIRRWNRPVDPVQRVRPLRICHVALNIPKAGRRAAIDFYLDRLGFLATDDVRGMGVFMRCPGDSDQHTQLLCYRPDRAGINHTAYEVGSVDEVVVGANAMIEAGWREARRLGRHTIGSNVFRFVHAPCGGRVELACDMDRVDDTYQTRTWEQPPPHHLWTMHDSRAPQGPKTAQGPTAAHDPNAAHESRGGAR